MCYLNAGTGDPCAGQERAMPDPRDILNEKDSMIVENFGAADPIGSMKIGINHSIMHTKYLNDGKGEACAGQVKAIPVPDVYRKVEDFENEENLGAAVPTGSKKVKVPYKSHFFFYLNEGKGEACAGHVIANPFPEVYKNEDVLENEENFGAAVPTGSKKCGNSYG